MHVSPETVRAEHKWTRARDDRIVPLINQTRDRLADAFGVDVASVSAEQYRSEVDAVFADGDRAVNITAYIGLLRELDVVDDYPGFVVDERLGRELAGTIAGPEPLTLLAQATFHVADIAIHSDGGAGIDDLDAALAAGFQTRLPGWEWREGPSPFGVDSQA